MAISESFTAGMGTILGVQMTPIANVTDITILDMRIIQSNAGPERQGEILFAVDGDVYTLRFTFSEETYDQRTQEGYSKKRNPKATLK